MVGCGSAITSSSSCSSPFTISGMRVTVLPPWPITNRALHLEGCSIWSAGSTTASNQRVLGMPGVSISFCEWKRPRIHS